MKLLRSQYERVVTASYLSLHPDAAQDFLDYFPVQHRKLRKHLAGVVDLAALLPTEKAEDLDREYERVRGKFEETVCETCGTKRMRFSWSPLDLASMAHHAEEGLRDRYAYCYYLPTLQAHATMSAMLERVEVTSDRTLRLFSRRQYSQAETALVYGQLLLIYALRTQNTYFKLGLDSMIRTRLNQWNTMLKQLHDAAGSLGGAVQP